MQPIVRMTRGRIRLRSVTMDDAESLLRWKNAADTRRNSIVTDMIIGLGDHLAWLTRTLADPNIMFYIIEVDGTPMGDLRLNVGEDESEISIRMDESLRGMGIATQVVGMVRGVLVAKIVVHNIASMRCFIANGFKPAELVCGPVDYFIFKK